MLIQTYRREVPGHDASVERTLLRCSGFCVAVLRARGIVLDHDVIARAVDFFGRYRRPQIAVFLSGRGYVQIEGRVLPLVAGDVVETDQIRTEAEGYAGSPCEVVIFEWDEGRLFEGVRRGPARVSHVGPRDVAHLRSLVARLGSVPADRFVLDLAASLRALGGPRVAEPDPRAIPRAPAPFARAYGALGHALSRLDLHPSLPELAGSLGLSERQMSRRLVEIGRRYGHPFLGWRDFIEEMRLEWAAHLLSVPNLPLEHVSRLAGYRSTVALCHAFSSRGADTPGRIARRLSERWR